jgi:hypothetical protein
MHSFTFIKSPQKALKMKPFGSRILFKEKANTSAMQNDKREKRQEKKITFLLSGT